MTSIPIITAEMKPVLVAINIYGPCAPRLVSMMSMTYGSQVKNILWTFARVLFGGASHCEKEFGAQIGWNWGLSTNRRFGLGATDFCIGKTHTQKTTRHLHISIFIFFANVKKNCVQHKNLFFWETNEEMIFPSKASQPSLQHTASAWFVEFNFETWSVGHEEFALFDLFGSMILWVSLSFHGGQNSSTSQHGAWQKRTVFMLAILEPRKANYDFFRNHFAGVNCYKEALNWNGFEIGSTSFQKYVHKNCKSISYDVYCIQALRMQNIYI